MAFGRNRLFRVEGSARDDTGALPWAVVLKVLPMAPPAPAPPAEDRALPAPATVATWPREARAYASGLLADLPPGLAAPRCYAAVEQDGAVQLWLEEVADTLGTPWPLDRFALAARHLGRFNGTWLTGRRLPDAPWLRYDLVSGRAAAAAAHWAMIDRLRDNALFRRGWPADVVAHGQRLFAERGAWLAALDRLPRVLRHGDADRRNLFARDLPGAEPQTVAIDWEHVGIGPLGADLGPLLIASVLWFQGVAPEDLPDLDRRCFTGYLAGLRDVGWDGDERLARLGAVASTVLQFGPFHGLLAMPTAPPERRAGVARAFGRPLEEVLDRYAAIQRSLFRLADEARGLLPLL